MEFHPSLNTQQPKNVYPCLAQINVQPDGAGRRRLSAGSAGSDGGNAEGGGAAGGLARVISGGRRKSSFGAAASDETAAQRRMSIMPSTHAGGEKGTWFWRVQAGVTDTHLVLLPLTEPPNPVLTHPPAPLSQAMPLHSAKATHGTHATGEDEGLVDKVKNLFRRGSKATDASASESTVGGTGTATADVSNPPGATPGASGQVDRVLDQTAQGEQLPSPSANAQGATNVNANAETGWPGVLQNGRKLGAVTVAIGGVDKSKVHMGGGKKNEACWVTIPITSHFASMVGEGHNAPKAGTIRLEFDKDWIGAKAEAELIHHQLTSALADRADRSPQPAQLQLPGTQSGHSAAAAQDIAPDESVASGTKVAGVA